MTDFTIAVHRFPHFYLENTEDGRVERVRDLFHVRATVPTGRSWDFASGPYEDERDASLDLLVCGTPESNPDSWYQGLTAYGSEDWGPEDEAELACFEADAYNEPRPSWAGY